MTKIAFPGLGINTFEIDPVAIRVFGLEIRWYGLVIMIGIVLAFAYFYYRGKQEGYSSDDLLDLFIWTVPLSIVGARLYYVLTNLDAYNSFSEAVAIWNGGIAIYGAVIAGAITISVVCRIKKKNPLGALDAVAPGVMIGQLIGRWGNFCNGEAFGDITAFEFFGKKFATPGAAKLPFIMEVNSAASDHRTVLAHPTFLYESLWNLVGFVIINALYKKKKFDGQVITMYIGWYGLGRMFIEGLRSDSLYVGNIKISQLIGLACVVASVAVLVIVPIVKRKKKETKNG